MFEYIFAVIMFALSITFLLSWGYIKEQRKYEELYHKLLLKIEKEIRSVLKKEALRKSEILEITNNTQTKLFWSKNKIKVTDAKQMSEIVINKMMMNNEVIKEKNYYKLK